MNAVKPIELNLVVNPKQKQFIECVEDYTLYGGAKGGGKSWSIRTKQMLRRLKYQGSRGLTLRRTYPELWRTHLQKIIVEWKGLGIYNSSAKTFTFWNGSVQEFGSCQYEHNVSDYQGAEYDDIGIDEATQFTEYMIETLKSNMRTTRTDLKTQMYLGANPGGVGHGYVKRTWVDDVTRQPGHAFIPAKVYDNHILMESDPEYAAKLARLPEALRKAFLDGDWNIFEGQALTEWRNEKHVVDHFEFPLSSCKKIICFDRGYNAPGCALFLGFPPENQRGVKHIYCYREIYLTQTTPEKWAQKLALYCRIEKISYIVLPHDCFANVDGRPSYAQIFQAACGKYTKIIRGDTLKSGARHQRLAILHGQLEDAEDHTPFLQIHNGCTNTTRTLPELIVDDHDPEDVNTHGEDHPYDALTLGLMTEINHRQRAGGVGAPPRNRAPMQPTIKVSDEGIIQSPDFWHEFKKGMAGNRKR